MQTLFGVTDRMARARQRAAPAERNAFSVRFELQADCFAGVWGHHAQRARDLLETGDIEEGMG